MKFIIQVLLRNLYYYLSSLKKQALLIGTIFLILSCDNKNISEKRINDFVDNLSNTVKINSKNVLDSLRTLIKIEKKETSKFNRTRYILPTKQYKFDVYQNKDQTIHWLRVFRKGKLLLFEGEYYSNGQIKCIYTFNEKGVRDGRFKTFQKDGSLKEVGEYIRGK